MPSSACLHLTVQHESTVYDSAILSRIHAILDYCYVDIFLCHYAVWRLQTNFLYSAVRKG